MLTVPAAISLVVSVLGLLACIGAVAASWGPGWGALRWFGTAALCASAYAVCALQTTLDVPPEARAVFGRFAGAFVSMLLVSWYLHEAAARGRALERWERRLVGLIGVVGALWLVPGVCRTSTVFSRHVRWLGVTYTTTRPTVFGQVTYALLMTLSAVLVVRAVRSWRRGEQSALVTSISGTVLIGAGVNDALAASGRLDMPYLLDVGQFVVVLGFGATLIARFVADARTLERSSAALRDAQQELVRRERLAALGELSAVVAHEVRNPVSVIFNAVATLRKQTVSTEARALIDIVDEEAQRLKRVAGELLEFARPRELCLDIVSPRTLVEGATEAALAALEEESRAPITVELADGLPDFSGDEQLLRQALINLATNAVQAAGRRGAVRVVVSVDPSASPSRLVFAVHDDGPGISSEVAARLFTPFFSTRATGSGLGLAIVKRIAEAHGGEVVWSGREPSGVTFALTVPLTRPGSDRG